MLTVLIGFLTGTLIGLTGAGGGVLLTPLLMVMTPYPAVTVIGTDILSGALTRLLGVFEHRRLGQVRWPLARWLMIGTVPGTIGGILLLGVLKTRLGNVELDHILRLVLGTTLFCVGFLLPLLRPRKVKWSSAGIDSPAARAPMNLVAVGAVVGFLVALTSVGSGSLLMVFLLLLTPYPLAELVGTDLVYGFATTALAGQPAPGNGPRRCRPVRARRGGLTAGRGSGQPPDAHCARALFQLAVYRAVFLVGNPAAGGMMKRTGCEIQNSKFKIRIQDSGLAPNSFIREGKLCRLKS